MLIIESISWEKYSALSELNKETLYFINDKSVLYTNGKQYSGKFEFVNTDPTYPELNTLYINSENGSSKIWNGLSYQPVTKGYVVEIEDSSSDTVIPTAKAVADYVQAKIGNIDGSGKYVTSVGYNNGNLLVSNGSDASTTPLSGLILNPSYDATTMKLTLPVIGGNSVEINLSKDSCVTAGKYNSATKEIWLTTAEDKTYTDTTKLIKIPASDLIDIYTSSSTSSIDMSISSANVISASVKISNDANNKLQLKDDGLYIPETDISSKLDKVSASKTGEVIIAKADGNIQTSGKSIGSSSLAASPNANTLATELAVKAYADTSSQAAITAAQSDATNKMNTAVSNAKQYADALIEWVNFS